MVLDTLGLVALVGGAVTGWPSGTAHQLVRLCAVIMAALGARLGLGPVSGFVTRMSGADYDTAVAMSYLLAFAVWFLVLWLAAEGISDRIRDGHERGVGDRYGGAGVGALKGGALAFVLAIPLLVLQPGLGYAGGSVWESRLATMVHERDFLGAVTLDVAEHDAERDALENENPWSRESEEVTW